MCLTSIFHLYHDFSVTATYQVAKPLKIKLERILRDVWECFYEIPKP